MIKKREKLNIEKYSKEVKDPQALFGLSPEIEYCSKCTISNQRPVSAQEFKHRISTKRIL